MPEQVSSSSPSATSSGGTASQLVDSILHGSVPRAIRLAAARGALPIARAELFRVLITLVDDDDGEISGEAAAFLKSWTEEELQGFASDIATDPKVLSFLLTRAESRGSLLPAVLSNPSTPLGTLLGAARSFNAESLDTLLLNQTLLIQHADLLEAVETNPVATPLHRARVEELRRHFFHSASASSTTTSLPAPTVEPERAARRSPDTSPRLGEPGRRDAAPAKAQGSTAAQFPRAAEPAASTRASEDGDVAEDDSPHEGTMQRIFKMNVGEKIQLASKGTREERTLLIRDSSRSVQDAVLSSPKLTENEIDSIARMRNVNEDILRQIAGHRDWVKTYSVAQGLATNPKTPIGIAMNLLPRLTTHDLKVLQNDKNVSEAIRRTARKHVEARANKAASSRGSGH